METITNVIELKKEINKLETKQKEEGLILKEQCKITYESLKPINLLKSTLKDIITPDLTGTLLNSSLSLAAGYVSKKALIGSTHNPLKQLLGTVLQMGVTSLVSKNTNSIKSTALNIISSFLKKKEEPYQRTSINISTSK